MVDVLLKTKLVVPPLRSSLVARTRLFNLLDGGLNRKLILLAAPAGYGKTTLLASWLRQVERPYAWLSLDEEDNDPVRFVQHFTAAIQSLFPSYGQTVQTFLSRESIPPLSQLLTLILNDLTEIPTEILLVLDDYHTITNPQLQAAIAQLVTHLPRQLHLVMTTRYDPALPLSRLRVRAQIQEIRARDLRFTTTESASFMSKVMGLELNPEDIHTLEARTEGWVAGLQIAALSLREISAREDQHRFIEAFSGSHRHVMDYLFAEVLDGSPPDTQDFLIYTSIAPRMCADLCNTLTGREDGQTMLEQLDADNYFVVPLDYEKRWYRYHHLFSNLLRRRMSTMQPETLTALYQRASAWFEVEGDLHSAIDLALDGGLYDLAAHLMVTASEELIWHGGEWETFNHWMRVLPEEISHAYPRLRLDHATYLHLRGQSDRAWRIIDDVAAHIHTVGPVDPLTLALIESLSTALARMTGDVPGTIRHGRIALNLLPDETTFWHGLTWFNLGAAYYLGDSGDLAQDALEGALTVSEETNNMTVSLVTAGFLAQLQIRHGHLHAAERIYRNAVEKDPTCDNGLPPIFTSGVAQIGLSSLLREWNNLNAAAATAEKGLSIGRQVNNLITILAGLLSLAGILQAQGDLETAEPLIKEAEAMLAAPLLSWTWTAVPSAAAVARLWLRQGRSAAAGRVLGGLEPHLGSDAHLYGYWNEEVGLAQARWMLANDDHKTAAEHLDSLIESSVDKQRNDTLIQALILQSLAFEGQGQAKRASRSLEHALNLAEPSGYVRTFIDEGPTMASLLARLTNHSYAAHLLQTMNTTLTTPPASASPTTHPALIEALSDRELQILRLMARRLSNREIADELYLATTTIKWYSRQIYRKLGVHRRREAAESARLLGLI